MADRARGRAHARALGDAPADAGAAQGAPPDAVAARVDPAQIRRGQGAVGTVRRNDSGRAPVGRGRRPPPRPGTQGVRGAAAALVPSRLRRIGGVVAAQAVAQRHPGRATADAGHRSRPAAQPAATGRRTARVLGRRVHPGRSPAGGRPGHLRDRRRRLRRDVQLLRSGRGRRRAARHRLRARTELGVDPDAAQRARRTNRPEHERGTDGTGDAPRRLHPGGRPPGASAHHRRHRRRAPLRGPGRAGPDGVQRSAADPAGRRGAGCA